MKTGNLLALMFILLTASLAQASSRSSANYSIVADSADAGGIQVTAANYANSGSVGGVTGLATVASPSETVKSGYIGQLYQVTGLSLASTFVADGVTQQLAATQTLDDGTTIVLLGGTQTWTVTSGQLPAGLTLDPSTGVISGTTTGSGTFSFTIGVTDGLGDSAHQTFTGTVLSKVTFSAWEGQEGFFTPTQQNDPSVSGPAIVYEKDGVPNLLKYVYNINPAQPMTDADRVALPVFDIPTSGASSGDLTLTFREYALLTGVNLVVQSSPDLKTWSPVTAATNQNQPPTAGTYTIQQTDIDPNTGDPYKTIDFKPSGTPSKLFIRLNVTLP